MSKDPKETQRYKIQRLLTSPDKRVGEASNVLSRLYRIVLAELNIGVERYHKLVSTWLNDPTSGIGKCPSKRSSARGNLNKEILRADMSPNVFLKALRVINVEEVEITVSLRTKGSKTFTQHCIMIENLPELVSQLTNAEGITKNEELNDGETDGPITGYRRKGQDAAVSDKETGDTGGQ